ncbi:MAG TPA: hypothetical protein VFM34_01445 [Moraxellaceae bacterium]|nr:hypothetical protein [Moraxellaceae bacterium]
MWLELYPTSFALFCLSGLVLMVGVWMDEKRGKKACSEQAARVRRYKSFADSLGVQ